MNKKSLIIIFIIIIVAAVAGIFYIYLKDVRVPGDLVAYMPRETVLYAELNLKDEKLLEFYANNFRGQARMQALFRQMKMFNELSKEAVEPSNRIALMVVKNNEEYHKVWLINNDHLHQLNALLPADYYSTILNNRTVALASNEQVLKLVKEVDPITEHSGEQREILNKFDKDNFLNIYVAGEYLKFLTKRPDPTYQLILSNLDLDFTQAALVSLQAEEDKVIYDFQVVAAEKKDYASFDVETQNFASLQNEMFLIFYSANLKDIYNDLQNILTDDKKSEWEQKYEVDWNKVEGILNYPGTIFVDSKKNIIDNQEVYDLSLYNYALLIETDFDQNQMQENIEQIKKVIKNILAFKYPIEKIKRLPDGSSSTELIADAGQFSFDKYGEIEYIESGRFNFAIAGQEGKLVLGNNRDLVKQILTAEKSEPNMNCEIFTGQEMMIINSDQLIHGLFSFSDNTVVNFNQKNDKINVSGCLMW